MTIRFRLIRGTSVAAVVPVATVIKPTQAAPGVMVGPVQTGTLPTALTVAGSVPVPGGGGNSPGSAGTASTGGAGGSYIDYAGNGGNLGGAGSTGNTTYINAAGGAAGNYINGNSYASWTVTGTRLGGFS